MMDAITTRNVSPLLANTQRGKNEGHTRRGSGEEQCKLRREGGLLCRGQSEGRGGKMTRLSGQRLKPRESSPLDDVDNKKWRRRRRMMMVKRSLDGLHQSAHSFSQLHRRNPPPHDLPSPTTTLLPPHPSRHPIGNKAREEGGEWETNDTQQRSLVEREGKRERGESRRRGNIAYRL